MGTFAAGSFLVHHFRAKHASVSIKVQDNCCSHDVFKNIRLKEKMFSVMAAFKSLKSMSCWT